MNRPVSDWPQLGSVHNNGDRYVGTDTGQVGPMLDRGVHYANKMLTGSVTELGRGVRIGDVLDVDFDGVRTWWAHLNGQPVGRLTWRIHDYEWRDVVRPEGGALEVTRLLLNAAGEVINFGGIVRTDR